MVSGMTTTFPPHASLLLRLSREWRAICHRPAVVRRAEGWQLGIDFRSLDDIVAAAGWRHPGAADARETGSSVGECGSDEVLARLVLAARHDDLAARVVLQRILPGVVAAARRWARRPEGGPEALDELLAAAWTVIRTYPVERRAAHLAARLLRDAEYHAFVRAHRRLLVAESVPGERLDLPVDHIDPLDDVAPSVELAELVAAAHALTDRDRQLLALIVAGHSVGEVAAVLRVSVRTVTNHREAMVSRLRQTARALAAA
jgi:DNA-binding CsgD family transcriptional regulator